MVHIGMATGRVCYSVERRGHRDGYDMQDVDGRLLKDDERREKEGDGWVWAGMPKEILSDMNVDDIWRRWRTALPVCMTASSSPTPSGFLLFMFAGS